MSYEPFTYTLRPNGEALWLPGAIVAQLGLAHRQRLTAAQYEGAEIQRLLAQRLAKEGGRKV